MNLTRTAAALAAALALSAPASHASFVANSAQQGQYTFSGWCLDCESQADATLTVAGSGLAGWRFNYSSSLVWPGASFSVTGFAGQLSDSAGALSRITLQLHTDTALQIDSPWYAEPILSNDWVFTTTLSGGWSLLSATMPDRPADIGNDATWTPATGPSPVPEPGSLLLAGLAVAGLLATSRRRTAAH